MPSFFVAINAARFRAFLQAFLIRALSFVGTRTAHFTAENSATKVVYRHAAGADVGATDETIDEAGATLFVDETAAEFLDDKVLDASVEAKGVRFTILNSRSHAPGEIDQLTSRGSRPQIRRGPIGGPWCVPHVMWRCRRCPQYPQ